MLQEFNQLKYLLLSLAIGLGLGAVGEPFYAIKRLIKNQKIKTSIDFGYFVLISLLQCFLVNVLSYPNSRLILPFVMVVGIGIYLKSFHLIVAKCENIIYNKLCILLRKIKQRKY